ncbi:unnamed protein product [Closterium sp. NIES-54]
MDSREAWLVQSGRHRAVEVVQPDVPGGAMNTGVWGGEVSIGEMRSNQGVCGGGGGGSGGSGSSSSSSSSGSGGGSGNGSSSSPNTPFPPFAATTHISSMFGSESRKVGKGPYLLYTHQRRLPPFPHKPDDDDGNGDGGGDGDDDDDDDDGDGGDGGGGVKAYRACRAVKVETAGVTGGPEAWLKLRSRAVRRARAVMPAHGTCPCSCFPCGDSGPLKRNSLVVGGDGRGGGSGGKRDEHAERRERVTSMLAHRTCPLPFSSCCPWGDSAPLYGSSLRATGWMGSGEWKRRVVVAWHGVAWHGVGWHGMAWRRGR